MFNDSRLAKGGLNTLNTLTTRKPNVRSFSISPENLTGEKGKGGMATEGSASYAARELGQGWKVNPYLVLEAGENRVLADVTGQGAVKHFWITDSAKESRQLILRFYFDGHKNPAVEVPLTDFFASADIHEYRWHIADPIYFEENLRVTIHALGWRSRGRYLPLQDDISSVAYWYSDNLDDEYPPFPDSNALEII